MSQIPAWLLALIKLAIQIGSPYLMDLIKKWFKNLPQDVIDIINSFINGIKDPTIPNRNVRAKARGELKSYCTGVGCKGDLV